MTIVNPFNAVGREAHEELKRELTAIEQERDDAKREASGITIELRRELENAGRLTELCARAVQSVRILKQALIERQIGAQRDPSLVLVVNPLPQASKKRHGFTPLKKRRREARKKSEADGVRRNALPTITAQLPEIPLTDSDAEAMSEAIADLNKETA